MHIHTRKFALIGGWIMLAMGVLSFIPALSQANALLPALKVDTSYGLFLSYFPMNIFNKVALVLFGAAGVLVSSLPNVIAAVKFSRVVCIVMGVLAVVGLIPSMNTFFGYWPLFRGEVLAHGVFAILGGYYGYVIPARIYKREAQL